MVVLTFSIFFVLKRNRMRLIEQSHSITQSFVKFSFAKTIKFRKKFSSPLPLALKTNVLFVYIPCFLSYVYIFL